MRVISGTARSLRLAALPGNDTRPTIDRIKETLFNMISPRIAGCRFLDFFAGSGAIGIEALSRGASEAVFVENSRKAADVIRMNLKTTHLEENAVLMQTDALEAVRILNGKAPWDIVFMDPPYGNGFERALLEAMSSTSLADADTMIIVEASKDTDFSWLPLYGYTCIKCKKYKTNVHMFIKKTE